MEDNLNALDDAIRKELATWIPETRAEIIQQIAFFGPKPNQVKGNLKTDLKIVAIGTPIDGIRFTFPRYGIFYERGTGKGYQRESRTNNQIVKNQISRQAKPWLLPVIRYRRTLLAGALKVTAAGVFVKEIKTAILRPGR